MGTLPIFRRSQEANNATRPLLGSGHGHGYRNKGDVPGLVGGILRPRLGVGTGKRERGGRPTGGEEGAISPCLVSGQWLTRCHGQRGLTGDSPAHLPHPTWAAGRQRPGETTRAPGTSCEKGREGCTKPCSCPAEGTAHTYKAPGVPTPACQSGIAATGKQPH